MEYAEFKEKGYNDSFGDGKFVFKRETSWDEDWDCYPYTITFFESSSIRVLHTHGRYHKIFPIWEAMKIAYQQGKADEFKKTPWVIGVDMANDSGSFELGKDEPDAIPKENTYSMDTILKDMDPGIYFFDGNIGGLGARLPDLNIVSLPTTHEQKLEAIQNSVDAKREQLQ